MAIPQYAGPKVPTPANPGPHFQGSMAPPGSQFPKTANPKSAPAVAPKVPGLPTQDAVDFSKVAKATPAPAQKAPLPPEVAQSMPAAQPKPPVQAGSPFAAQTMDFASIMRAKPNAAPNPNVQMQTQQGPAPADAGNTASVTSGLTQDQAAGMTDAELQKIADEGYDHWQGGDSDAHIQKVGMAKAELDKRAKAEADAMQQAGWDADVQNLRDTPDRFKTVDIPTTPEKLTGEAQTSYGDQIGQGYNDLQTNIAEQEAAVNNAMDKATFQAEQKAMRRNAAMGRSTSGIGEASLQGLDAEMASERAKQISDVHSKAFDQERQRLDSLANYANAVDDRTLKAQVAYEQASANRLELAASRSDEEFKKIEAIRADFADEMTTALSQLRDSGKADGREEKFMEDAYMQFAQAMNADPPLSPADLQGAAEAAFARFMWSVENPDQAAGY